MFKRLVFVSALVLSAIDPASAATARAPVETTPFELTQNFLRQIGTFERDRLKASKDQTADPNDFASCVRNMTTFQIHLGYSSTYMLSVKLADGNMAKAIPPLVGAIINQKYVIVGDIIKNCQAFMTYDPKTNYAQIAQRAPQTTAFSNEIDKNLMESSSMMFTALISPRGDSKNRANHMVITRAQRAQLLDLLASEFGDELNMTGDNVPYYVAMAQLYRDKLNEFKCADDPWE